MGRLNTLACLLQTSLPMVTKAMTAALAANTGQGNLRDRLAAVQATAASQVVMAVQTGLAGHQKLIFAIAAAAAMQLGQGQLSQPEWEALLQPAAPVQLNASLQVRPRLCVLLAWQLLA